MAHYQKIFSQEGLTFKAVLEQKPVSECRFWLFPGRDDEYLDFSVWAVDSKTEAIDYSYYTVSRVIDDSEGLSMETLLKYIENFKDNFGYMNLKKEELAA